jgi:hypothetical protein
VLSGAVIYGVPVLICLGFSGRPWRFGLSLVALAGIIVFVVVPEGGEGSYYDSQSQTWTYTSTLHSNRSFFGVRRVQKSETRREGEDGQWRTVRAYHSLIHGGINHGSQRVFPPERRDEPITYFHPKGPIGEIFTNFKEMNKAKPENQRDPYAVVGLGIGTLASYSQKGQHLTFYEIDPTVKDMSLPPDGREPYFYYLQDALKRGVRLDVDIGDGRLRLQNAPANYYHVLVLDAFSSDAIPVHLLTLDALDMYLTKVAPDGVIIYNVTNNYVNMPPVLADQARARGLVCLNKGDYSDHDERYAADWVVMARKDPKREVRRQAALQAAQLLAMPAQPLGMVGAPETTLRLSQHTPTMSAHPHPDWPPLLQRLNLNMNDDGLIWKELPGDPNARIWRDNYSNLLGVMTWDR